MDKNEEKMRCIVYHKSDEGQNRVKKREIVVH